MIRIMDSRIFLMRIIWVALMLTLASAVRPQSAGNIDLRQNVIAGGGNSSTGSGNLQISGTVGQPAAGTQMNGGTLTHVGGFWPAILGAASALPSVQFSSASYTVSEGSPLLTITVNRLGDTTAGASVTFATSDSAGPQSCNVFNGLASARCDYHVTFGRLRFGPAETSKTVSVSLIDDSYVEGNETFTVNLGNPSGASLGVMSTATVTIIDNDTITGPNPIDDPAFLVRLHYLDFLNREPDVGGLQFWIGNIIVCGSDPQCIEVRRINVSASFYLSIEFQQTGYLVERIYKTAYGDGVGTSTINGGHQLAVPIVRLNEFLADTQEIGDGVVVLQPGWETILENNKRAFTAEFVQRPRFFSAFPVSMTPAQLADTLFLNAGVTPSAAERQAVIDEFAGAPTSADVAARGRALRLVAENAALQQQEFNRAFVLMQYFGYLRRNPNDPQDSDYTGYDFWLNKLNQFNGNFVNAEMVKAFITSIEYRQRFAP